MNRLTGFASLQAMLAYVAVVCEGDEEDMTDRISTSLTLLEEWFCYFEVTGGMATTH